MKVQYIFMILRLTVFCHSPETCLVFHRQEIKNNSSKTLPIFCQENERNKWTKNFCFIFCALGMKSQCHQKVTKSGLKVTKNGLKATPKTTTICWNYKRNRKVYMRKICFFFLMITGCKDEVSSCTGEKERERERGYH